MRSCGFANDVPTIPSVLDEGRRIRDGGSENFFGCHTALVVVGIKDLDILRIRNLDVCGNGDEAVFTVPRITKFSVCKEVSVVIVGEEFGVIGDEKGTGFGGEQIGSRDAATTFFRQGGGDGQGLEDGGLGVVHIHTAVEEGRDLGGGVVVDGNEGAGVGDATDRSVAGDGALGVLVELVGGVIGNEGFAEVVVFGGGETVANGVVVVIKGEAGDLDVVVGEGAAGGGNFGAGVIAVVVLDGGVVKSTGTGNGGATTEGVVGIGVVGKEGGVVVGLNGGDEVALGFVGAGPGVPRAVVGKGLDEVGAGKVGVGS